MNCYKCGQKLYTPADNVTHIDSYYQDDKGIKHVGSCENSVAKQLEKPHSKIKKLGKEVPNE